MEDIYSAIVGEPTSDQEKLLMIADQLRKRQQLGQLGQITGDRVLAPMGAGMVKQAETRAEDIGRRGETARYRKYQEGASARMDERARAEQAWREKDSVLNRAAAMERERMGNATLLEAAKIRAASVEGKSKFKPMTPKQVDDLTTQYEDARQFSNVATEFKDGYAGLALPGMRGLSNAMAANLPSVTTKSAEDAQNWWAKYNNLYTLPQRNKLFGATLTPTEQAEWKKNAISENMTPDQIKTRLTWFDTKRQEKLSSLQRNLKLANYNPELIDAIFSDPADSAGDPEEEVIDLPPR